MDIEVLDNAYIGANVRAVRVGPPKLELRDLSERLEQLGYPVGVNSLSKLETNRRKITAEELVHLAVALDVTPNRLLLGTRDENGDLFEKRVRIAERWTLALYEAWEWAQGTRYPSEEQPGVFSMENFHRDRQFQEESRPHNPPSNLSFVEYDELREQGLFDKVDEAVDKVRKLGFSDQVIIDHIDSRRIRETVKLAKRYKGPRNGTET